MSRLIPRITPWLLAWAVLIADSPARAETTADKEDEQTLHNAGLSTDGAALLAFFHARARTDIDPDRLRLLLRQFTASTNQERSLATAEFLGLGPLAVPTLRRAANDLETPELARRAQNCLHWLEGPPSANLPAAAARVLAAHKPDGAAAALLAYLPFTDNAEVLRAVTSALAAVAAQGGKPNPALLSSLADPMAVRRAAAGIALARANPPDQVPAVRKLLQDPAPGVRLRTALALAEAHDAEAIPVLIDLLADLPSEQRHRVEEYLQQLAGEWSPASNFVGEDEIARKIRRDAWAAWWRNVDGASLLAAVRKRTLTVEDREKIRVLLGKLGAEDFATREGAAKELFALGRRSLPQLREATKDRDAEVSRQAKQLIERIELEPSHHLPTAAIRLLAVRKPSGSVESLLAYLPYAEDENLSAEARKSLTALALREGQLDPALVRALSDAQPLLRSTAAEALAKGGGEAGRAAVRKLLKDAVPDVRMRVALALALVREREGVPVLIDLLTVLSAENVSQVEDALYQLAGDSAPDVSLGEKPDEKKKCRDAWAAWWKINADRVDLARLTSRPWLGYTLLCDCSNNRVFEVGRDGKQRWAIENVPFPVDAWVLPGNRVLIAEYNARRSHRTRLQGQGPLVEGGLAQPAGQRAAAARRQHLHRHRSADHRGGPRRQGSLRDQQRARRHHGRLPGAQRQHRRARAERPVPDNGHDGKATQELPFQPQRRLDQRHRFAAKRPHPHHAAGSQQGGGVRCRGENDRRSGRAGGDDGDGPAQRPHAGGQPRRPTRLRGGPRRQGRLGVQGDRQHLPGAAALRIRRQAGGHDCLSGPSRAAQRSGVSGTASSRLLRCAACAARTTMLRNRVRLLSGFAPSRKRLGGDGEPASTRSDVAAPVGIELDTVAVRD